MQNAFVPLFPVSGAAATSSAGARPLQVRPGGTPPPAATFAPLAASAPASTCAAEPVVTFKREGDRVARIQIECPCGQKIVLDCEY